MKFNSLYDLLVLKLQALYDIESELIKALPKMSKNANDSELKQAFTDHLEETTNQLERLEEICRLLDEKPKKMKVEAIRGLIEDAGWVFEQKIPAPLKDSLLIASAQYVEHFEMAGYTTASTWAQELELSEVVEHLNTTLEEEKTADEKLSDIAIRINADANIEEGEE